MNNISTKTTITEEYVLNKLRANAKRMPPETDKIMQIYTYINDILLPIGEKINSALKEHDIETVFDGITNAFCQAIYDTLNNLSIPVPGYVSSFQLIIICNAQRKITDILKGVHSAIEVTTEFDTKSFLRETVYVAGVVSTIRFVHQNIEENNGEIDINFDIGEFNIDEFDNDMDTIIFDNTNSEFGVSEKYKKIMEREDDEQH